MKLKGCGQEKTRWLPSSEKHQLRDWCQAARLCHGRSDQRKAESTHIARSLISILQEALKDRNTRLDKILRCGRINDLVTVTLLCYDVDALLTTLNSLG
jgi:hypothetical protein